MISEQEKNDIIFLYNQGNNIYRIAERLSVSVYYVRKTIAERGLKIIKSTTRVHRLSKKKQILELWGTGLHNINIIAKKLDSTALYVNQTLNRAGILTLSDRKNNISYDIKKYLEKEKNGESVRGFQSELAKKYKCSRQNISIKVKRIKEEARQ